MNNKHRMLIRVFLRAVNRFSITLSKMTSKTWKIKQKFDSAFNQAVRHRHRHLSTVFLRRPCRQFTVLTHVQNAHTQGESAGDHPSLQNTIYHTLGEHTTGRHRCCQRPSVKPRLRTPLDTTSVITLWEKHIDKLQLQVIGQFHTLDYSIQCSLGFSYYFRFVQTKNANTASAVMMECCYLTM